MRLALVVFCAMVGGVAAFAEVFVRISEAEYIFTVVGHGRHAWIGTTTDAYRVDGNSAIGIFGAKTYATTIAEIDGETWIGTKSGLFRVIEGGSEPVPILDQAINRRLSVNTLVEAGGTVWLGSPRGLYRVDDEGLSDPILREEILSLATVNDTVWVGSSKNAYRVDSGGGDLVRVLPDPARMVSDIIKAGDDVWLITNDSRRAYSQCYRWRGGDSEEVPSGHGVVTVAQIGDEIWLGTTDGAFLLGDNSELRGPIGEIQEPINVIASALGYVWIGSTRGIYRSRDGVTFEKLLKKAGLVNRKPLDVGGVLEWEGHVWIWSNVGAFRFDEDVDLLVRYNTVPGLGFHLLVGDTLESKEVRYDRGGSDPYGDRFGKDFKVLVRFNEESFERDLESDAYEAVSDLSAPVSLGMVKMFKSVYDGFGNYTRMERSRTLLVLPRRIAQLVYWWFIWAVPSFAILLAAPWSDFAMGVVVSPVGRMGFSLAWIPIFLRWRRTRRYLLQRYMRELPGAREYSGWEDRASALSLEIDVDVLLQEKDESFVLVAPATSSREEVEVALKYLTWKISKSSVFNRSGNSLQHGFVPIYLPLSFLSEDRGLIGNALRRLERFGRISDGALGSELLNDGDFVFLLSGMEELDEEDVKRLRNFLDDRHHNNVILLGSVGDQGYFGELKRLRLEAGR